MKFLTDEHVPPALARGLRLALGEVDVLELRRTSLLGASDPDVLAFAAREGRILVIRIPLYSLSPRKALGDSSYHSIRIIPERACWAML